MRIYNYALDSIVYYAKDAIFMQAVSLLRLKGRLWNKYYSYFPKDNLLSFPN